MPAHPVPIERMIARSSGGKTLGKRDLVINDVSKMEAPTAPAMPDGLQERGQVEWVKIWTAGRWLWPDQDYHLVEQIARAYDDLETFRAEVVRMGLTVEGYNGQTVANPLLKEMRALENGIRANLSLLGFSPSDRARLKLTELKSQKTAQELLNDAGNQSQAKTVTGYVYKEGDW